MKAPENFPSREEFCALTRDCFKINSLSALLTPEIEEKLYTLSLYLLEQNERGNLTAITRAEEIIAKHLADSVAASALIREGASLVDVGSGAGFPALPLAIVRPDLSILAIESNHRKVDYINSAAALVGATNIRAICARAEEAAAVGGTLRESFDCATARGVAELRVLCELCMPFVKPGGRFLALKGKRADEELANARGAIGVLGGEFVKIAPLEIRTFEGELLEHCGVVIAKKKSTPAIYPRAYTKISKKPL